MLLSPQSPQSSTGGRTRHIKLRSACNQCCASKVKCSGQRTGCERCRSTGSNCVYAESRVGKVPGVRAKRKQMVNHDPQRSQSRTAFSSGPSATSDVAQTELGFQNNEPDTVLDWSTGWQLESDNFSTDFQDNSSNIHVAHSTTTTTTNTTTEATSSDSVTALSSNEEFSVNGMEMNLGDLLMSQGPPPIEQDEGVSPAPQVLMSLGMRPRNEIDSQCCLECCHIINDVENYIMAELKAFKIILGIVRKALEKVVHLMELQQSSRNLRCLMLFTTIMYQILELFELCLSSVAAEKERQQNQNLTGGLSGLTFGDFSFDAEEQSAFRIQTILREIHHATEVLGKLRALAGVETGSGMPNGSPSAQARARGECYLDLELRYRDLATRCQRKG